MNEQKLGGARFQIKEKEVSKIVKVFGWTVASAVVAMLIQLTGVIELPMEYAFIVPVINTALVALSEWIADNRV